MLSIKDIKTYLTKDKLYKVSKEDIKSFQNLLFRSESLFKIFYKNGEAIEERLEKKIFFIKDSTFNKLKDIFKETLKKNFSPYVYIKFHTLNDAIKHSNIIPTILFYYDEDYEIKEKQIKINIDDFILSYKTIEIKTIEILNFLKNKKIRPDLKFKIRSDINLKINRPLKPFIIPESELKSKKPKQI